MYSQFFSLSRAKSEACSYDSILEWIDVRVLDDVEGPPINVR